MPCSSPNINNIQPSSSPSGIPGFGSPFAPSSGSSPTLPSGQPEDLNALFNALEFLTPIGPFKPPFTPNYDRDVLDGIMKLLSAFMPFFALYQMFLPVLNIIICIIEVICAIPNPFKLIDKIQKLFRQCIPDFLALFPQFALIVIILSIINLLISFIEYVINQILILVAIIQQNINTIERALSLADGESILAATAKIGNVLCSFQNIFVILALFQTLIAVIQDVLRLVFNIPPCADNSNDSCCSPDVCPSFIKDNTDIKRDTGTLQYFNEVAIDSGLVLPPAFGDLTIDIRKESWQFYDASAPIPLAFINITHAFDLPDGYNIIFFPTDTNYTSATDPSQVPYLVNLRLFYNPISWGILTDPLGPRFIRINSCIVLNAPTTSLSEFDNSSKTIANGVLNLTGGLAFEDNGKTPIDINGVQATLNTFIHMSAETGIIPPPLNPTDGYTFSEVSYDFIIQHPILLSKALITLGCVPSVGLDRAFVNTVFGNNINFTLLNNLALPDVPAAQLCMATAIAGLQNNISNEGLATFQSTMSACLSNLQNQATTAAATLIGIGFDANKSTFTIAPSTQFTTQPIKVSVTLAESSGTSITNNLSPTLASTVAGNIKADITLGAIDSFVYDGYSLFTANLTSKLPGNGTIKVSYQNQVISTVNLPSDLTQPPSISETVVPYTFIYSPAVSSVKTAVGDTEGAPRLDNKDVGGR